VSICVARCPLSASFAVRMSPSISHTHISINIQARHFFPFPKRFDSKPSHPIPFDPIRFASVWFLLMEHPEHHFCAYETITFCQLFDAGAIVCYTCGNGSQSAVAHVKHSWRAFKAEEKHSNPIQSIPIEWIRIQPPTIIAKNSVARQCKSPTWHTDSDNHMCRLVRINPFMWSTLHTLAANGVLRVFDLPRNI